LGATKLVVKDMQTQHLITIASLTTNDRFAPLMNDEALLKAILKAAEVDAEGLLKTKEELEGMGPSERETEELNKIRAEVAKLNAEAERLMAGDGQQGPEPMSEKDLAENQLAYDRIQADLQLQQMKLEQAAIEASDNSEIRLAEIQSRFELGARADETKRLIKEMEERRKSVTDGYLARLKAEEVSMKKANLGKGFDTYG
jgi:hypothetical protein